MLSNFQLTEDYLRQWVKTASDYIDIVAVQGTVVDPFWRMRVICKKCHQTLTCDVPASVEKIDWALQKFVGLHRHDPIVDAKLVKEVQDRMNAPKVTPLTADFKPVKVDVLSRFPKEGRRFREIN